MAVTVVGSLAFDTIHTASGSAAPPVRRKT
jgi:hypothetical protein